MTQESSRFPLRGAPGHSTPEHSRSAAVQTAAASVSVRGRVTLIRGGGAGEDAARVIDVGLHLDEQVVDRLEADLGAAQAGHEVDGDPGAVQLEVVAVQDVRLDPAVDAVEGRVAPDA